MGNASGRTQIDSSRRGETIPDELALKWNEEKMTKLHSLGTFVQMMQQIPEKKEAVGYRRIKTRYVYDAMKQMARLVLQDIRKGATRPEDFSPIPSLSVMELQYATFQVHSCTQTCQRNSKLWATYPLALRDRKTGMLIPYMDVKLLYRL
eukprot:3880261-Amphidinium_carterae.1